MRLAFALIAAGASLVAQKQPFTVDALLKIARISEPVLSPDGRSIAFTVERPDLTKNTRPKQIYTVSVDGGTPVQLTTDGNNQRPVWSPNASRLVFISSRTGTNQVWSMNRDGSDPKQLTTIATGASGVTVSADSKRFVFLSSVYPDCPDDACNKERLERDKITTSPRVYTSLLYRHWNEWQGPTRSHLFVAAMEGGTARDLTPGNFDVPPFSLGGPDDYAISPDGTEVAYISNTDPNQATSTNADLFTIPIEGGEPKRLTSGLGADRSPVYSPDGKWLAFRSQLRAGYESDRWRLMLLDRSTGIPKSINDGQDRNVENITWSSDSTRLFYVIEDRGRNTLQTMPAAGGSARAVFSGNSHIGDVQFTPDNKTMIYTANTGAEPVEIYRAISTGGKPAPLTKINDEALSSYQLTPMEEYWVESPADKARIHTFVVKPANFQPDRKYPLLVLIHGGPQGAWGEAWSYRWNPQIFASAGYVVIMPNPRGSTGYGQKFTDDINQDWGGKAYEDLMASVDHAAALPYVDPDRMAAAGGSYGGYMVNWLLGHSTRFKTLVSHAGVYDLRSMAGETEELWFPLWEFRGMPWENPEVYDKFSPSMYAKEFKTPTLVFHGELDYRVPVGQGMQLYTALQMQKVPSKLVLFPDEGHWVLKPKNSEFWYRTFLEWVDEWTRKSPAKPAGSPTP
ncbi:MAG: S9 family peptidase [Bryobacteraceae bacterium]|nr:S9 family peptidase [Bryobacteraceae bacterium]